MTKGRDAKTSRSKKSASPVRPAKSAGRIAETKSKPATKPDRKLKAISKSPPPSKKQGVTWDTVSQIARMLPGAEEGTSYGTPAFKVRGKLFVRFHQSGESVVISVDMEEREALMTLNPGCFYITDHYTCWPWMLVRLSEISRGDIRKVIEASWRRVAPKALVDAYDRT